MDFLIENWKWLTAIGLGLLELILLLIFKKRPQINFRGFLESICGWILQAENKFTVGSEKMSYVLACARTYLGEFYDEKSVRAIVEYVLTLPQKKKEKINEK